ncbi:ATP-dependent DNA ligase LigA [Halalkalicoccus sp. GCM10025322]|uniref:ATP-dependent DNA ligase LigA n=1 Tax=Halalkalicoccus TaxID=332246 RepID=UPI002F96443A
MEFEEFDARAAEIEAETADLEIERLVAALLADANDDLAVLARFVQGRVFPAWDSRTLDIGPQLCYEAIARAAGTNVTAADVEERLAERGEIGEVAASYEFGGQQGLAAFGEGADALTVSEVDEELRTLAAASGSGSQERKLDALFGLFNRCSPEEARYLSRLVLSEMRIGVGSGTVRDAIGDAFDVPPDAVERALQVSNDYGLVAEIAREAGESGLSELSLEIGRPVQAMLAQTGTVVDAIEDWGEVAAEWKFDGARVQIHYTREEDGISIYSRNMEEVTDALPEVVAFIEEHLDESAILDGEVVAVDDDGAPLPFQEVLRRFRRKHDVERAREETELRLYAFDCLHAAGEDLLDAPLEERYERLSALLSAGVSERWLTDDPDEIAGIEGEALEAGHEGLMLKNPDSTYSPGRRGRNWRKRKPDVETLDLVVTGAEWGEGRRATFLGSFLLSVATESGFETIGKVATGISDEKLAELTELLDPHVLAEEGRNVEIRPEVVFEVGYEEIQRSPTYESGYALRFPRILGVRDDKHPEDADSLSRIRDLYGGEG